MIGTIKETISHLRKRRGDIEKVAPDLNSRIKTAEENKGTAGMDFTNLFPVQTYLLRCGTHRRKPVLCSS